MLLSTILKSSHHLVSVTCTEFVLTPCLSFPYPSLCNCFIVLDVRFVFTILFKYTSRPLIPMASMNCVCPNSAPPGHNLPLSFSLTSYHNLTHSLRPVKWRFRYRIKYLDLLFLRRVTNQCKAIKPALQRSNWTTLFKCAPVLQHANSASAIDQMHDRISVNTDKTLSAARKKTDESSSS